MRKFIRSLGPLDGEEAQPQDETNGVDTTWGTCKSSLRTIAIDRHCVYICIYIYILYIYIIQIYAKYLYTVLLGKCPQMCSLIPLLSTRFTETRWSCLPRSLVGDGNMAGFNPTRLGSHPIPSKTKPEQPVNIVQLQLGGTGTGYCTV